MDAIKFDDFQYYTYDDYKAWEDRWELIGGIAYAMAPAPYPIHQEVASNLYYELRKNFSCKEKQCKFYLSPVDWKIDEFNIVQPDIALFCEKTQKQFFSQTPPLIIEVLSKSTAFKDVTTKYKLYEEQGVKYYIIVEPNSQVADILELVDGEFILKKKVTKESSYSFKISDTCTTSIDFSCVFEG